MKRSEARSIAVKKQYEKISKKIEEACKDGLECIEYKKGLLFDEIVKQFVADGFLVVLDYTSDDDMTIISWLDDVSNDDGVIKYVFPVVLEKQNEDGTVSCENKTVSYETDEILSYDELLELVNKSLAEKYESEEDVEFVVDTSDENVEIVKEEQSEDASVMNEESIDEKYEVVENIQTENGRVLVVKANNNEE